MTTFEGIFYAIVQGITEFLPLGSGTHHQVLPHLIQITEPSPSLMAALYLGSALAVLGYFRHDWASMFSSILGVIVYRRPPMTIDERIPIFITLSTLPAAVVWFYFHEWVHSRFGDPVWSLGSFIGFGILLFLCDHLGRKNKGTYDWNWLDSILVGLGQILVLLPGSGVLTAMLCSALIRNYRREAAVKFALFCSAPLLCAMTIREFGQLELRAAAPAHDLNWLTFGLATFLTLLISLLAISGLMKQVAKKTLFAYASYRVVVGIGVLCWFLTK